MAWLFPLSVFIGIILFSIRHFKFANFHLSFVQTQFLMGLHQASLLFWLPALFAFWYYGIKLRFNIDTILCLMAFTSAILIAAIGHPVRKTRRDDKYYGFILLTAVIISFLAWLPFIGTGLIQANLQKIAGLNQQLITQKQDIKLIESPPLEVTYAPRTELQVWQVRGAFEYQLIPKNDLSHLSPKKILAFQKKKSNLYVRYTDVHWQYELTNHYALRFEQHSE